MKNKIMILKTLFMFMLGITIGCFVGTLYLGREKGSIYYQIGFIVTAIFIVLSIYFYKKQKFEERIIYVSERWPYNDAEKVDLKKVKKFFENISTEDLHEKDFYVLDEQTCNDLNLDDVFKEINITGTTAGEQILYYMLRTPKIKENELKIRDEKIEMLNNNYELREKLQVILLGLGKQNKGQIINLFNSKKEVNKLKKVLCNLAAILPVVAIISCFFIGARAYQYVLFTFFLNVFIHYKSAKEIEEEVNSIAYAGRLITVAKRISNINNDEISDYRKKIKEFIKPLGKIEKKSVYLAATGGADILIEYINILLLTKIRGYYDVIDTIKSERESLIRLYKLVGEIDALISMASYRERVSCYSKPNFAQKNQYISIEGGVHPLIAEPVSNSVTLDKKGIVLTGSNMSGKSTFLRMIGINALLAQTFYTTLTKNYNASFLRIFTSLSISDDVNTGKSYYLGECEALLKILNSINDDVTALCMIDEIFRGTNPVERIASSKEIIKYIMERNAISIVATHDIELTEVAEDKYEHYYFCEDVDENEGLVFDYKMKNGVCKTGNAIKLLKYLGYPSEITKASEKEVEKSLKK